MASFDKKMAGYGDAMVATAALLARLQLPGVVQGFWTERSERSVLPTALSIIGVQASEKDLLGRWKPEGSNVYARCYGGRVAKLHKCYAGAARRDDRYVELDEKEIGETLADWLVDRRGLRTDMAMLAKDRRAGKSSSHGSR